jgi:hypothetical protein
MRWNVVISSENWRATNYTSIDFIALTRALSQSWLLEAKSESRLSENQLLASLNFPVFGNLRQSLQKTHFHYLATAMAINLQRFVDWVWEIPRAKTRQSHFARLELAA